MSKLVSFLFSLARKARNIEVLASGDPLKMARRQKNKQILKRSGKLWRFPKF